MAESEKTQQEVSRAIQRTTRQVFNLTQSGVFAKVPSAADPTVLVYPWPSTLERWLAYQGAQQKGDAASEKIKKAELRAAKADAEMKELRLAQLKSEIVRRTDYDAELRRVLTAIAGVLDLAPGKHGPRLPGDAPVSEKVAALRAIMREVRGAMRRAGAPPALVDDSASSDSAA